MTFSLICYIIIIVVNRQHIRCGSIAQLGEHLPYKQRVTGSSPVVPTTFFGPVVQLVRTLACHARGRRFEPDSGRQNADVAHLVERHLAKVEVAGSSPVIRSKEKRLIFRCFFPFVTKIFFVYIIHCKRFRRHSQGVRHESAKL